MGGSGCGGGGGVGGGVAKVLGRLCVFTPPDQRESSLSTVNQENLVCSIFFMGSFPCELAMCF